MTAGERLAHGFPWGPTLAGLVALVFELPLLLMFSVIWLAADSIPQLALRWGRWGLRKRFGALVMLAVCTLGVGGWLQAWRAHDHIVVLLLYVTAVAALHLWAALLGRSSAGQTWKTSVPLPRQSEPTAGGFGTAPRARDTPTSAARG